jgi:hypothetical protein
MSRVLLILSFLAISTGFASAQYGPPEVPARFNYQGSAVCPENYDYVIQVNRCVSRAYGGGYYRQDHYRRGYGGYGSRGGVPAQFDYTGSAICPQGYEYVASYGACFPQRRY